MVLLETSQDWLRQSALLLEARPETTRITTKYTITPPKPAKPTTSAPAAVPKPSAEDTAKISKPRANIELKTYDPVSGTVLKYRTVKAAEVGRLVMALGTLGRGMAGLPKEEGDMGDEGEGDGAGAGAPEGGKGEKDGGEKGGKEGEKKEEGGGAGGGGKKKKKKGKK